MSSVTCEQPRSNIGQQQGIQFAQNVYPAEHQTRKFWVNVVPSRHSKAQTQMVGSFRDGRGVLSDSTGRLSELHRDAASLRLLVVLRGRSSLDTLTDEAWGTASGLD
jgi:hypothetical protein